MGDVLASTGCCLGFVCSRREDEGRLCSDSYGTQERVAGGDFFVGGRCSRRQSEEEVGSDFWG